MIKKTCLLLVILLALICILPATEASAAGDTSGNWENLSWEFDGSELYIYGNGTMPDATTYYETPWAHLAPEVEAIRLEEGITTIGDYAFFDFPELVLLRLPDSLIHIGEDAFFNCTNLTWIFDCNLTQKLPDGIKTIADGAFCGCAGITELDLGAGVTYVGQSAFSGLTELRTLTLSPNLQTIESHAFAFCFQLRSVSFPASVEYIGRCAFYDSYRINSLQFAGSAPQIYNDAFTSHYAVINAVAYYPANDPTWTSSVKLNYGGQITWQPLEKNTIAAGVCGENVTWVLDANGLLTISGTGPMYHYDTIDYPPWHGIRQNIIALVVRNGVTTVGSTAFYKCYNLSKVSLAASVNTLEDNAFFDCPGLLSFFIGPNITTIEEYALHGCQNMKRITVDSNNPCYSSDSQGVLYDKNQTILIQAPGALKGHYCVPEGVTEIEDGAFYSCDSMTGITLPDSLEIIGNSSFSCCWGLTELTIPKNVFLVEHAAFWYCQNMEQIHFLGDAPVFEEDSIFVIICATITYPANNPSWTADKFVHSDCDLTWIPVETDTSIFAVGQARFCTLQAAITYYQPQSQYIQLLADTAVDLSLEKDLWIDLNGHTLGGTMDTDGYAVYGLDTATDIYDSNAAGYFQCYDWEGNPVIPQRYSQLYVSKTFKNYLTAHTEQGYTFHRFQFDLTHLSLDPHNTAFGYKALFFGTNVITSQVESIGYRLWLDNGPVITGIAAGKRTWTTLRLKNIDVDNYGETPVYAQAILILKDGTVIATQTQSATMRQMVEAINQNFSQFSQEQQTAVKAMAARYPVMQQWDTKNLY